MTVQKAIARNLTCLVTEHDVNITRMCKELMMSRTSVYKYMSGMETPSLVNAWLLAEYFGITLNDLTDGADRVGRRINKRGEKQC